MTRRPAFTLIELLVVVAIIALLVSILLPSLGRARRQAKFNVCASQQRQIAMAALLYAQEERHMPPSICQNRCLDPRGRFWAKPAWINYHANSDCGNHGGAVWPFLGHILPAPDIFICPLSPGKPHEMDQDYQAANTVFLHGSYFLLWNYRGFEADGFFGPENASDMRGGEDGRRRLSASDRLLLSDRLDFNDPEGSYAWDSSHPFPGAAPHRANTISIYTREGNSGIDPQEVIPSIRLNAAYLDGHVRPFDATEAVGLQRPLPRNATTFVPRKAVPHYDEDLQP